MSRKNIVLEEVDVFDKLEAYYPTVSEFIGDLEAYECELAVKYNNPDISVNLSDTPYGYFLYLEVSRDETDIEVQTRLRVEKEEESARNKKARKFKELKRLYDERYMDLMALKRRIDCEQY